MPVAPPRFELWWEPIARRAPGLGDGPLPGPGEAEVGNAGRDCLRCAAMCRGLDLCRFRLGRMPAAGGCGLHAQGRDRGVPTVTYGGVCAAAASFRPRPSRTWCCRETWPGGFRFKAVYIREPWSAASLNLYAYQQAANGDVLLQEAKYLPPFSTGAGARYGFTGRQLVYSADQRSSNNWCELVAMTSQRNRKALVAFTVLGPQRLRS